MEILKHCNFIRQTKCLSLYQIRKKHKLLNENGYLYKAKSSLVSVLQMKICYLRIATSRGFLFSCVVTVTPLLKQTHRHYHLYHHHPISEKPTVQFRMSNM